MCYLSNNLKIVSFYFATEFINRKFFYLNPNLMHLLLIPLGEHENICAISRIEAPSITRSL